MGNGAAKEKPCCEKCCGGCCRPKEYAANGSIQETYGSCCCCCCFRPTLHHVLFYALLDVSLWTIASAPAIVASTPPHQQRTVAYPRIHWMLVSRLVFFAVGLSSAIALSLAAFFRRRRLYLAVAILLLFLYAADLAVAVALAVLYSGDRDSELHACEEGAGSLDYDPAVLPFLLPAEESVPACISDEPLTALLVILIAGASLSGAVTAPRVAGWWCTVLGYYLKGCPDPDEQS